MVMGRCKHRHRESRSSAWNSGVVIGAKRPLKAQQIWAIRFHLDHQHRVRDRALFDLAIDSKLRGCDLVKLKVGDVAAGPDVRRRATVIQQKTGRPVTFEITDEVRRSLLAWLDKRKGGDDQALFPSRIAGYDHITTRQYARLVDGWVEAIGLNSSDYGTHSLRRTKVSMLYKRTGNLRAVQILLGHTKIESTVRYLGVDVDDALALSETTDV
jgi:integrase